LDSSWFGDTARWYLALVLITWGLAPAVRWLLGGLPDKGASVARPAALLFVLWPTWFLAGSVNLPFTSVGIWLTLAVLAVIGWGWAYKQQWITRDWIRTLLVVEAVSLATFALYIGLRGYTPQLAYTEKPMDMMFMTSSYRTDAIPPSDAWMSGQTINYYYLGYLIYGTLSRIVGISTWIGYNLALATTASMAFVAAGGAAYNIIRRTTTARLAWVAGVLAGFLVVVSGNLRAAIEFVRDPSGTWDAGWWDRIGWQSSRIIVDHGAQQEQTINEFPWFSLLLGDLHPHLTALPFTLLAITIAVGVVLVGRQETLGRADWGKLVLAGAIVGSLYPLNSLDLPTYLVLLCLAILVVVGWNRQSLYRILVVGASALVAWLPFTLRFVSFAGNPESLPKWVQDLPVIPKVLTTVGFFSGEHTSVSEFLTVFGLVWLIALLYLGLRSWEYVQTHGRPAIPRWVWVVVMLVLLLTVALPAPVIVLAGLPVVVGIWLVLNARRNDQLPNAIPEALIACAFGLVLITEFFYVQDVFSGRYNTLFKVYYQVWALLGVACAVAAVRLFLETKAHVEIRTALAVAGVAGLLAALAYPVIGTQQWTLVHGPRDWQGLNSVAFMTAYSADDVAAMQWLYDNATSDDIVIEAPGCSYQVYGEIPTSGMSALTGVPTIIGWDGHESQWRAGQSDLLNQIVPRQNDVAAIYGDPQSDLVDQYDATLLYVGTYERNGTNACERAGPYPSVQSPDFPGEGWEQVFSSGQTAIYRRVETTG
jgi:YYY domain-containing protein